MEQMEVECRTCLDITDNVVDIFFDRLPNKITTISSLEISPDDGLPTKICNECVRIVHLLHDFRTQIIKTRETLEENADLLGNECRTCLKIIGDQKHLNVFSNGLSHKIETISSVEVSPDDRFSKNICVKCIRKVESLYRFRNMMISSWKVLVERKVKIDIKEEILEEPPAVIKKPTIIVKRRIYLYKCVKCNFLTENYFTWKFHMRRHEEPNSLCEFCGKLVNKYQFVWHWEQHTESFVTCNICSKTFKHNRSLLLHIRTHTQKTVKCPECGIVLKSRTLTAHMLRHKRGNNKPLKCSLCESRFHKSSTLKRHIRSHTGERPYICEICSKGFSSTNALKTHIMQHTQEKPYKCDYCDAAFKQAVLVRRHLKSKHPEKVVQKSSS